MPMAKSSQPSKRSEKARKQKNAYMRKYMAKPANRKENGERWTERRKRGIAGKGGKDLSHGAKGKMTLESPAKNRARNGKNGKSSKRKV